MIIIIPGHTLLSVILTLDLTIVLRVYDTGFSKKAFQWSRKCHISNVVCEAPMITITPELRTIIILELEQVSDLFKATITPHPCVSQLIWIIMLWMHYRNHSKIDKEPIFIDLFGIEIGLDLLLALVLDFEINLGFVELHQ